MASLPVADSDTARELDSLLSSISSLFRSKSSLGSSFRTSPEGIGSMEPKQLASLLVAELDTRRELDSLLSSISALFRSKSSLSSSLRTFPEGVSSMEPEQMASLPVADFDITRDIDVLLSSMYSLLKSKYSLGSERRTSPEGTDSMEPKDWVTPPVLQNTDDCVELSSSPWYYNSKRKRSIQDNQGPLVKAMRRDSIETPVPQQQQNGEHRQTHIQEPLPELVMVIYLIIVFIGAAIWAMDRIRRKLRRLTH
ncbi:hypothetical protein B9Z19DRAFT_1129672 [Tuber borchii]|uniref:Uncharacterized protein n=1 Tax=Tuber borchii TaxID=42251 RepID=A0A2T6ZM10_TUBBO|nr:hypothetical protein B9Z19DRAFT_1129672 [Tuber borchii]